MPTRAESESAANWARGYEEGFADAFERGFAAGLSASKQKLLTFYGDNDELPDAVTAWARG